MNNAYGALYEIGGFPAISAEAVERFENAFLTIFMRKGSVAGSIRSNGWMRVHTDRNSEYPDLDLEISPEGRLLVCDMDVHHAGLLEDLRALLNGFQGLNLVKLLDVANGDNVREVP